MVGVMASVCVKAAWAIDTGVAGDVNDEYDVGGALTAWKDGGLLNWELGV